MSSEASKHHAPPLRSEDEKPKGKEGIEYLHEDVVTAGCRVSYEKGKLHGVATLTWGYE